MLAKDVVAKQMAVIVDLGRDALADLSMEEIAWQPTPNSWTVHDTGDRWIPDWVEPEPDDLDPPSLGWQLWHAAWWLSMVLDRSFGPGTLTREMFEWEGPERGFAVVDDLQAAVVDAMLAVPDEGWIASELTRWPYTDGRPFGLVAGWVSMELTKNVSEMVRSRSCHGALAHRP